MEHLDTLLEQLLTGDVTYDDFFKEFNAFAIEAFDTLDPENMNFVEDLELLCKDYDAGEYQTEDDFFQDIEKLISERSLLTDETA